MRAFSLKYALAKRELDDQQLEKQQLEKQLGTQNATVKSNGTQDQPNSDGLLQEILAAYEPGTWTLYYFLGVSHFSRCLGSDRLHTATISSLSHSLATRIG